MRKGRFSEEQIAMALREAGAVRANLVLIAVSLLCALAVGEALARRLGPELHPAAKYRFHRRYGWTMDPGYWHRDNLQPSGFRTPPRRGDESRRSSGPRVLVLGDSFTAAMENRWSDTFPGIVAADVEARGGALASLASGGWGTAQEYLALLDEGIAWNPDVVVLQVFPYNDLCNNGIALAWTCSWQDHLRPYFVGETGNLRRTWLHPVRGRLRSFSKLFGLLDRLAWKRSVGDLGDTRREFNRLTREFNRARARRIGLEHDPRIYSFVPEPAQPPPVRQAWRVTEALFAAIAAELDSRGIPLVAVVVPFSKSFDPDWREFRRRRPAEMEPDYATRRVETAWTDLGASVVSVRRRIAVEELTPAELFNPATRHLSAKGHRCTARWILEALTDVAGRQPVRPQTRAPRSTASGTPARR